MEDQSDWQMHKSLVECNKIMLNQQLYCDVQFSVGSENGTIEQIGAHKYNLIARSPVFFAMFCGDLQEAGSDPIRVPDIEPLAFKQMLMFLYCDETALTEDVVLPTLYAAKKYLIPALVEKCILYLEHNLCPDNVCLIYEQSIFYDESVLVDKAHLFIETRTEEVLKSPSFSDVSCATLIRILKFGKLTVSELELFQACLMWSEQECLRQQLEPTGENKRQVLGDALFLVRFPTIPLRDFANQVARVGILTAEEKCAVFEYLTCERTEDFAQHLPFPTEYRQKPLPSVLKRFTAFSKSSVCSGDCSIMKVWLNKAILLKGFGVSSSSGYDPLAEVQITIKQERTVLCNKCIPVNDDRSSDTVYVMLGDSVILRPETWYTLILTFHFFGDHDQGSCKRGKGGYRSITCDGVSFDFDRADSAGFVPELLFCKV